MVRGFLNRYRYIFILLVSFFSVIRCTSSDTSFSPNVAGPNLSFSVTTQGETVAIDTFNFGLNTSSSVREFTLSNRGDWEALIEELSINAPFSFTGGNFPGTGGTCQRTIPAKSNCTISLSYAGGSEDIAASSFSITYSGVNYRKTLTVRFSVQSGGLGSTGDSDGPTPPILAAPTLHPTTPILPKSGPLAGGTVVVILGSHFQSGATVTIGGIACGPVNFLSSSSLSCPTPPHSAGSYDVVVLNPDGQSVTLANAFTYNPAPTVASSNPISPNQGPLAGGNSITITGTGFLPGAAVTVGGLACSSPAINLAGTTVSCNVPPHLSGSYNVVIENTDGQTATVVAGYTYNAAPTLGGFALGSPTSGALAGGTLISLTGTGFLPGATIKVGGTNCTSVTIVSSSEVTCLTPPHSAGDYTIVFTNSDGQSATMGAQFTYNPFPTLAGSPLSPLSGPLAGGTALTISGGGFLPGANVKIGGTDCLNISVVSSSVITCNAPAHAVGTYDLLVTNADTQSVSRSNIYTYNIAPSFGAIPVTPSSGPPAGGTSIMISGAGFQVGATVTIGGIACTNVVVLTASTISCDTPANSIGSYAIVITNPDLQTSTLPNGFTYNAPPSFAGVNPISPASGPTAGGTLITISGNGFISGATVKLNNVACSNVSFIDSSHLQCTTPAGSAGVANVVVTNPDLQAVTLAAGFTYNPAPTFNLAAPVSPANGPASGGTYITLSGTGFINGASVTIGNTPCAPVVFNSATSLSCTTLASTAGVYDVTITNPDLQFVTLANAFTYDAPPTLSLVSPNQGPGSGGTAVTLTGTGFINGATVSFGGAACVGVNVSSSTTITCSSPAHAVGSVAVTVTNPDGQSSGAGTFTYSAAPTVTSVFRSAGALAGGTSVTVSGTGFISGATVDFGGSACINAVVNSPLSLTCTTSAHIAGIVPVTVTNPDLQMGLLAGAYVYQPAPIVSGISSPTGSSGGGTWLTITGQNFLSGAIVTFNGVAATWSNVIDSNNVQVITPPGTIGPVVIRVTNSDTQYGENANIFSYTFGCGTMTSAGETFDGGNGQLATPYLVATAVQLDNIRKCPSNHYKLTSNIDLTGFTFLPIPPFTGTLDGDGKTISNFSFVYPNPSIDIGNLTGFGLFSHAWGGSFKNLSMSNVNIDVTLTNDGVFAGALVGYNSSTVDNVHILSGTVRAKTVNAQTASAGGIAGYTYSSTIQNSSSNATVIAGNEVGQNAMAGAITGYGFGVNIINSNSTGSATASNKDGQNGFAGGIMGYGGGCNISNSYSLGNVTATNVNGQNTWAGGLLGGGSSSSNNSVISIQESYALGIVTASNTNGQRALSGGIAGDLELSSNGSVSVSNSFSKATLSSNGNAPGAVSGGIFGNVFVYGTSAITITNSYASGPMTGGTRGGLIAAAYDYFSQLTIQVNSSYWNSQTTGVATSVGGGTAVTSAQMLLQNTFVGWDFVNTWALQNPSPVLQ